MAGISNHYDTIVAVKTIIDGLNLSGLTGGTVIQEVCQHIEGANTLPFVSISPYGPEKIGDELNDVDGVYYGILVAIIGHKDVTSLEQRLGWRQKMRRNLHNHGLPTIVGGYTIEVEPGNAVEPRAYFDLKAFASGFVVRAFFQEPRS